MDYLDLNIAFEPFLAVFILLAVMVFMVIMYMKVRIFLVILMIYLFSIILGINSLALEHIPLNPYVSIFFLLFQSAFFLQTCLDTYRA